MNLNELFKEQAKLDKHIIEEKGLQGQNLLKKKTVALICELYECCNEGQWFKFWKENPKPRTEQDIICSSCDGTGDQNYDMVQEDAEGSGGHIYVDCENCDVSGIVGTRNPLLEEYVDTIHFALSIANDAELDNYEYGNLPDRDLNVLVLGITNLATLIPEKPSEYNVRTLLNHIIKLGYQLGFDEKQVIDAYYEKNKINHARQENGY